MEGEALKKGVLLEDLGKGGRKGRQKAAVKGNVGLVESIGQLAAGCEAGIDRLLE